MRQIGWLKKGGPVPSPLAISGSVSAGFRAYSARLRRAIERLGSAMRSVLPGCDLGEQSLDQMLRSVPHGTRCKLCRFPGTTVCPIDCTVPENSPILRLPTGHRLQSRSAGRRRRGAKDHDRTLRLSVIRLRPRAFPSTCRKIGSNRRSRGCAGCAGSAQVALRVMRSQISRWRSRLRAYRLRSRSTIVCRYSGSVA